MTGFEILLKHVSAIEKLEVCTDCGFIKFKGVKLSVYFDNERQCCPSCSYMDLQEYCYKSKLPSNIIDKALTILSVDDDEI